MYKKFASIEYFSSHARPKACVSYYSVMKLLAAIWLFTVVRIAATTAVVFDDMQQQEQQQELLQKQELQPQSLLSETILKSDSQFFDYRCFDDKKKDTNEHALVLRQPSIGLHVSNRVTHQLMTRIFAIFLREFLNYRNVSLIPIDYVGDETSYDYEVDKLVYTLSLIRYHPKMANMTMINLEVWMPPTGHVYIPSSIFEAGQSITPGRFGWFVPEYQVDMTDSSSTELSLNYKIFLDPNNFYYDLYVLDDKAAAYLRTIATQQYINPKCVHRNCVTVIAEFKADTAFVMQQLEETRSYVNVLWLGSHFRHSLKVLHGIYSKLPKNVHKRFIVLHWMPSDVIDDSTKYKQIMLPKCEDFRSLQNATCKYEFTPVLKYYSKSLIANGNERLLHALREFMLSDSQLIDLYDDLNTQLQNATAAALSHENIYNAVACKWFAKNVDSYTQWISEEPTVTLSIGGIFPIRDTSRGHENLVWAVRRAVEAINRNSSVLANYNLAVLENDGQCKADVVMKAFIHYFNLPNVLGVLGPACSETVEPIAGISKHTSMAVISYSAEGASFVDRKTYPYFFRTIGSNRQYTDVYINLMKHLGWRRVAALTEDGQKYTEYISHMETAMKQRNLELIVNKKFLSDVTAAQMNKYLLDLKQRHAKIIIADIHTTNANIALCEAYKLGMTASEGYVWFLPSWISKNCNSNSRGNDSCSCEQLQKAFEGHLSIMHTPFGSANSQMQENLSIEHWLTNHIANNETISNYTGFAYDAVWAYALAADKLLKENPYAVTNLRSSNVVERFVQLIWKTDFEGLSGRVRFGEGGSRITEIDIVQWNNHQFVEVGKFHPTITGHGSNLRTNGGELIWHEKTIRWLSNEQPPGDGTYDCSFADLAEFMGTDCENAAVAFTAVMCVMAVIVVSLISFLFWKRRYDYKLKRSAKIMKTFGIDLLSPSRSKNNTLDKWEIPKENVVVNRRLGEGAFGTVYGGEAQLNSEGWTAVAVKTLKAGASTEDRLDFLSEAEAMKRFDHKNIVKLLGVCLQSEPIYTIMEFMLYGDLKTYLLARRHMVNDKISDESDISAKRLTMYAMDVARGLAYLAQQKYVHRDIACRNCLVNAQRVVKLGDFGMARPTFESDYYRFNRKGMLPVRWMAPESLALGLFTPASDVWAFGVVLYEIITFGSFPYQGLTNNQALEYVKSGNTLQIPTGVKPHLEGLLKSCWAQEVKKRPTANEIVEYISNAPRLLMPCLDFPGASVEMPETESDQLELLPKARKCSPTKKDSTLDILTQTTDLDAFELHIDDFKDTDMHDVPEHINIEIPTPIIKQNINAPIINMETFSPVTPEGYSIMSPLLKHQVSECSDSSQAQLLKKSSNEALQETTFLVDSS